MWNWFNCYLSGRHDYGVWCEPGSIFLRCVHCGRRSSGWALDPKTEAPTLSPIRAKLAGKPALVPKLAAVRPNARVLPFDRAAS